MALAHDSICQAFGGRRGRKKPRSALARHRTRLRVQKHRAKLATLPQVHEPTSV